MLLGGKEDKRGLLFQRKKYKNKEEILMSYQKRVYEKMTIILVMTLFFALPLKVMADSDDFCSGTWSDPTSLTTQWFESITDYYSATNVGFWWNSYSLNVKIDTQTIISPSDRKANIRINGSPELAVWGSTQNYISILGVAVPSWSGTWSYSVIDINTGDLMDESIYLQKKVIAHEIGHALGLDHPEPKSSHKAIIAIMKQGDNG